MKLVTIGALASALAVTATGLAQAAEPNEARAVVVSLRGIDTATEAGADQALERIRGAARDACRADFGRETLIERSATTACIDEAMQRAVDDLGSPAVSDRFHGDRVYAERGVRS